MNETNIPSIPAINHATPAKKSPEYNVTPPIPNKIMAHIKIMIFLNFTALIGIPICVEIDRNNIAKINQVTPWDISPIYNV